MNNVKLESIPSESSGTAQREKANIEKKIPPKITQPSPKMKIILFVSIGITVCSIISVVVIVLNTKKSSKKYESEISDLKTEKGVLENQNFKMKSEIKNLTKSNSDLNQTLNEKLNIVSNDEVKRNKTYQTLEDISKEGVSLKTTFSQISKNIESINVASVAKNDVI